MKKIIYYIVFFIFNSVAVAVGQNNVDYTGNIQQNMDRFFAEAKKSKQLAPLTKYGNWLASRPKSKVMIYWQSMEKFYEAQVCMDMNDDDMAQNELTEGINMINEYGNKDSELYALLAAEQSLLIKYAKGMRAGTLSMESAANAEKAISADSANMRAWLIAGMIDYFTPKFYGGGKKAEKYLSMATSLPEQKIVNPYLPSWGKEMAYILLIQYYLDNKQTEKARKVYSEAVQSYPESNEISKFKDTLSM